MQVKYSHCQTKKTGEYKMKICPKCNNQLEDSAAFCDKCGANLTVQQTPQPTYNQTQPTYSAQQPYANYVTNQQPNVYQPPVVPQQYKQKGLKAWHIVLITVGAIIIIISMIAYFVNENKEPTDYFFGGDTSYNSTTIQNIPIVGDWQFDMSDANANQWVELMFMAVEDKDSVQIMINEFGEEFFVDIANESVKGMTLHFGYDNTCTVFMDPDMYRSSYITSQSKMLDAMAKMDLDTIAKIKGVSVEELQSLLDEQGMTWAEKCEADKQLNQEIMNEIMTDENLADMVEGTLNENGIIEISSGQYSLEGNRLSLIDKETTSALTVSYKNQVITIEGISSEDLSADSEVKNKIMPLFKGSKLKKVG